MKSINKKSQSDDITRFKKGIVEDIRPWGKFRSFPHKSAGSIKIITVNPGETLSLQYHKRRSEFWVVLDRGLEVTVGFHITGDAGLMTSGGTWDEKKFVFEPNMRARTYEVIGTRIVVSLYNPTAGLTVDDLIIGYYLTT